MGCQLGKLAASERRVNNQALGDGPPPATDPRLPLTAKQKYSMLASWKGISRAMEKTGICMFIKLFEENEELLHLFEDFRELRTKEAIVNSAELAEHATKVMHTLDEGIKGLADMDTFFAYVRHVGATHQQVPGFHAENFMKIEQPFLEAAKTTLGERYTPNIENIYKLTIRFILENLVKGYEEAGKENGKET